MHSCSWADVSAYVHSNGKSTKVSLIMMHRLQSRELSIVCILLGKSVFHNGFPWSTPIHTKSHSMDHM